MDKLKEHIPCYFVNPKDGTETVLIPGGWFWMGSGEDDRDAYNSEKPRHLHYVEPFYLGIGCITVGQFRGFVKETRHNAGSEWEKYKDPDNHPVRYVNWHDGKAYCAWAGLRLPTEAEWELAARGYGALKYPWGNDWEDGRRVCWGNQKGPQGNTVPVFAHPEGVSSFGAFQQSGNVWEWCADGYDGDAYKRYARGETLRRQIKARVCCAVPRGTTISRCSFAVAIGATTTRRIATTITGFASPGQLPFTLFLFSDVWHI